ncbi:MAG TPA: ERCC4 domain-containing protein [Candidatus Nanoarchaeia archaeon]|nr:ERCC4 domain-containing protein [Candidatus Nanoarchaeia archaeon]
MTNLIIDHREKQLILELEKRKMPIKVKQLALADIIITGMDYNQQQVSIAIERKTQEDFLSSIIDKRILTQLIEIKEHFQQYFLIIEGQDNFYQIRNFHPNAIRGMLLAIALDLQIPIIQTRSIGDTAALIETLTKRLEKPKKPISLLSKRKPLTLKEQQEYLIESLPGIGVLTAKSLLSHFKSVSSIILASEKQLQEVPGVGKLRAKEIKNLFNAVYQ